LIAVITNFVTVFTLLKPSSEDTVSARRIQAVVSAGIGVDIIAVIARLITIFTFIKVRALYGITTPCHDACG
jgi:hypothetical protein